MDEYEDELLNGESDPIAGEKARLKKKVAETPFEQKSVKIVDPFARTGNSEPRVQTPNVAEGPLNVSPSRKENSFTFQSVADIFEGQQSPPVRIVDAGGAKADRDSASNGNESNGERLPTDLKMPYLGSLVHSEDTPDKKRPHQIIVDTTRVPPKLPQATEKRPPGILDILAQHDFLLRGGLPTRPYPESTKFDPGQDTIDLIQGFPPRRKMSTAETERRNAENEVLRQRSSEESRRERQAESAFQKMLADRTRDQGVDVENEKNTPAIFNDTGELYRIKYDRSLEDLASAYEDSASQKFPPPVKVLERRYRAKREADFAAEQSKLLAKGYSKQEIENALRDHEDFDFRDRGGKARKLRDGRVIVRPGLAFDEALWNAEVDSTDATPEAKNEAKAGRIYVRERIARKIYPLLIDEATKFRRYAQGKLAELSPGQIIENFRNENGRTFNNLGDQLGLGTKQGMASLLATGNNLLDFVGADRSEDARLVTKYKQELDELSKMLKGGRWLNQLAEVSVKAAPTAAVAAITKNPWAAPVADGALDMADTFGEARDAGYGPIESRLLGVGNGVISTLAGRYSGAGRNANARKAYGEIKERLEDRLKRWGEKWGDLAKSGAEFLSQFTPESSSGIDESPSGTPTSGGNDSILDSLARVLHKGRSLKKWWDSVKEVFGSGFWKSKEKSASVVAPESAGQVSEEYRRILESPAYNNLPRTEKDAWRLLLQDHDPKKVAEALGLAAEGLYNAWRRARRELQRAGLVDGTGKPLPAVRRGVGEIAGANEASRELGVPPTAPLPNQKRRQPKHDRKEKRTATFLEVLSHPEFEKLGFAERESWRRLERGEDPAEVARDMDFSERELFDVYVRAEAQLRAAGAFQTRDTPTKGSEMTPEQKITFANEKGPMLPGQSDPFARSAVSSNWHPPSTVFKPAKPAFGGQTSQAMLRNLSVAQQAILSQLNPTDVEIYFRTQRDGLEAAASASGLDPEKAVTRYRKVLDRLTTLGAATPSATLAGTSRNRVPAPRGPRPDFSPNPEKWLKQKGSIQWYDDGTWEYTDWEGNEVKFVNGHPDFAAAGLIRQQVDIVYTNSRTSDNSEADGRSQKTTIRGNRWHHHENRRTLQEVAGNLNNRFYHEGGRAEHERLMRYLRKYGYKF